MYDTAFNWEKNSFLSYIYLESKCAETYVALNLYPVMSQRELTPQLKFTVCDTVTTGVCSANRRHVQPVAVLLPAIA